MLKGKKNFFVDFYVSKSVYDDWRIKGKEYKEKAQVTKYGVPSSSKRKSILVPKTETIKHFERVVKACGFTLPEAVLMALNFFMEQKKDVFGEVPKAEIDESTLKDIQRSYVWGKIDREIVSRSWKFIQRYNAANVPGITFSDFLESAIVEKLQRLPLKLTDPEMAAEVEALKEYQKKVEQIITE
ncbi:MAG: hypothetical protein GX811_06930 [Lentisphaerae bacterium]|nr:hypothetical protein [Lentisphaerota bacterium]